MDFLNPAFIEELLAGMTPVQRDFVHFLLAQIAALKAQVLELQARLDSLERKSHNSNKPPSSDGLSKPPAPKSLRSPSGKKPGAQEGHEGARAQMKAVPDVIEVLPVESCARCGTSLHSEISKPRVRRQVWDIPPLSLQATEFQAEVKDCPCCGLENQACFPVGVNQEVTYGPQIKSLSVYLGQYHYVPYGRLSELFEDLLGHSISPGSLYNFQVECAGSVGASLEAIRAGLLNAPVVHFDETGVRCEGKTQWGHVSCTPTLTHYFIHPKRGMEAMESQGIITAMQGRAIHDHWKPYFAFVKLLHGLCNQHHLRELRFLHEEKGESWAGSMRHFLQNANQAVRQAKERGEAALEPDLVKQYETDYQKILKEGFALHESLASTAVVLPPTRGRKKQAMGKNLLDRLQKKSDAVLVFLHDFRVPFTNNQAEQDIRMLKLKGKISGCFRSAEGATCFAAIRSYVSTARKQGERIWNVLNNAFRGEPFMPKTS